MRKTIIVAKGQSELYLLKSKGQNKTKLISQKVTSKTWANSQIWLQYRKLGHSSFNILKSLLPYLFTIKLVESFKCDICQLSKHHTASYPISAKRVISH